MAGVSSMGRIARLAAAFSIGLSMSVLGSGIVLAQSCATTANCAADRTCQPGLFGGECRELRCNANSDCPAGRRTCLGGVCQTGCASNAQCRGGLLCVG